MIAYQIMIEGVFLKVPGEVGNRYGFHTTFYVDANNASNAVHRVRSLLKDRMGAHGVKEVDTGIFKTYLWVHDLWEITGDKLSRNEGRDSGFTFFQIRRLEGLFLYFRRLFFTKFKPWLMIQ